MVLYCSITRHCAQDRLVKLEQIQWFEIYADRIENFNLGKSIVPADLFDLVPMCPKEDLIERLPERRTTLISATINGKIDVRHWQAPHNKTRDNATT